MDEEDIFLAALNIASPQERSAFVAQRCGGNSQLLVSVETLLRHHTAAGDFLETPPAALDPAAFMKGDTHDFGNDDSVVTRRPPIPEWTRQALSPATSVDQLGRLGHYEVLDVLGSGGMGVILRARDAKLHRLVAIKILAPESATRPDAGQRFLREARATALVRHPNVVTIHGIEENGPFPYIVMEFVRGGTLQQKLDAEGPFELQTTLRVGLQITEGLAAAHAQGLVHRDIKPANILLEGDAQEVKIADFGVAQAACGPGQGGSQEIVGTPQYMSPEQARGQDVDHRSDLFCLGGVLYAMCTGRAAYSADSALAALRGLSVEGPPPIQSLNPSVPAWLAELIHRLLNTDPRQRPQTAGEVAVLLRRHLTLQAPTLPASIKPAADVPPADRWTRVVLLATAGLVAACAVIVVLRRDGVTTRIEVPNGANVKVTANGQVEVDLPVARPAPTSDERPKDAVPAAETRPETGVETWERSVRALAVQEQLRAVTERMKQLNPAFAGRLQPTIQAGEVIALELAADGVTDLSPLRALSTLTILRCDASNFEMPALLSDLSPLRGLALKELTCASTTVRDLQPLRGMPLELLNCAFTPIDDLTPLHGLPLRSLAVQGTRVEDLAPLHGMPLDSLNISHTRVTDLSPLRGLKLINLYCDGIRAADFSPLQDLPLRSLNWRDCDRRNPEHLRVLKSITTLELIDSAPAEQFWRELNTEAP